MSKEEMLDFTDGLIKTALENKHPKSSFLRNYSEVRAARLLRNANGKLADGFRSAANEAFKQYKEALEKGLDTFTALYSYRTYRICQKFYSDEYNLYADLLNEFLHYTIFGGHIVDVLLGGDRTRDDLKIDFRTMQRIEDDE